MDLWVAQVVVRTGADSGLVMLKFHLIVHILRVVLLSVHGAVLLRKIFGMRFDELAARPLQRANHLVHLLILLLS